MAKLLETRLPIAGGEITPDVLTDWLGIRTKPTKV